jgi:hypothetical protein
MALMLVWGSEAGAFSFGKTKYIYKKGSGTWVKVCPGARKQGPFDHPREVSEAEMRKALGSLMYFRPGFFSITGQKGKEYRLFTTEEIDTLSGHLAQALATADSSQWVDFSINTFRGQSLVGSFRQSDGVMFIKDGKLHVALRNISAKTGIDEGNLNSFDPTRGYRSTTRLQALPGQEQVADNWVVMDLNNLPSPPVNASVEEPSLDLNISRPREDAPEPAPAATEPSPAPAAPGPAKSATERLRELQNLYDQGLITEQEYQEKRKKILEEL